MAKILLLGLETPVALQLSNLLRGQHQVAVLRAAGDLRKHPDAQLVFCGMDSLTDGIAIARGIPFVAVSRLPDTHQWIDALEAGAADYCGAPFESRQIHWIVEGALPRCRARAA